MAILDFGVKQTFRSAIAATFEAFPGLTSYMQTGAFPLCIGASEGEQGDRTP